jgi:hypothetical protein
MESTQMLSYDQASGMNRKARRMLGKENGMKFHGRNVPIKKTDDKKKWKKITLLKSQS